LTLKDSASTAAVEALRPLVELLLELGVTSPEAESLLRSVYVHAGKAAIERNGEDATFARIGLLTGVHRNEVAEKLKSTPRIDPEREQRTYGANRVLAGWHNDVRYMTGQKVPRVLEMTGDGSFESLVQTYAPNISVNVVLDEMVRLKAVEKLPTGEVRARTDSISVAGLDAPGLLELGARVRDYTSTLSHNVREPSRPRVAETIMSREVSPLAIPLLMRSLRSHTRLYVQQIESEMNDPRLRRDAKGGEARVRLGISVFYFEEELEDAKTSPAGDSLGKKKATIDEGETRTAAPKIGRPSRIAAAKKRRH